MNREQIAGIILDIFNEINERSEKCYEHEITEYTETSNLEFDALDKTCVLLKIHTAFQFDFNKEDIFNNSMRICDVIDLIENKFKLDDYCKTCNRFRSYYFKKCSPNYLDYLKMVNDQPFCDYYVKKDVNMY